MPGPSNKMYSALDSDEGNLKRAESGLDDGSEHETLLEGDEFCPCRQSKTSRLSAQVKNPLSWLNFVLLVINIGVIVMGATKWKGPHYASTVVHLLQPQIASPSPAEAVMERELRRFTELDDHFSPLTADPSPEVDQAWDEFVDSNKVFEINEDQFREINGNPRSGVRVPNGGGFIGILEVTHQLHCVEIMRRGAWFNIDYYREKQYFGGKSDANVKWHMRHCFELLRQSVQCNADESMLTYNWVRNQTLPEIASKTLHSCQNWDRLREWRVANDATDKVTHLERPKWVFDETRAYPGPPGAAEPQVSWETEVKYVADLEAAAAAAAAAAGSGQGQGLAGREVLAGAGSVGPGLFLLPRDVEIRESES